ncbi:hypothetical protein Tc00.1047053508015.30 [Trypanosoma cruzi]|uniref:Uncharacterized protein n=1 Tax=Trypanosoma cruzi (strain CL Brener) TaxID=353153 RepID=Q4CWG3_TRYCC|nr:hypothetical protein Tc00.1047053508015.30 [Trypanosoma cruzi]EAN84615.1 hypothetical protein Tc00.1047053508015.30 [Trypanosoma cruzi]|eukprot:XP_806466.1 hypothetical protein [Trypanosoma cruzi strain CL Brener]
MNRDVMLAIAMLFAFFVLLFFLLTANVYKRHLEDKKRRRRQERLRDCPQAEPFAPPVSLPVVVDAVVVFPSHEEAQHRIEEDGAPITRVPSELPGDGLTTSHEYFASAEPVEEGNALPRARSGDVLQGVPVDRSLRLPDVNAASRSLNTLSGATYRLRPASAVYGSASYLPRSSSSGGMTAGDVPGVLQQSDAASCPETASPVHVCEAPPRAAAAVIAEGRTVPTTTARRPPVGEGQRT